MNISLITFTILSIFVALLHSAAVFEVPNHLEQYRHLFPHLKPNDDMEAFLMTSLKDDNTAILETFIEAGLSPDHRDQNGVSYLMHAAQRGSGSVARLLLYHRSNPSAIDSNGFSVLMHAVKSQTCGGNISLIWNLVGHGADIDHKFLNPVSNVEYSFFSLAIMNGFSEVFEEFSCFLDIQESINKYLDIAFTNGKTGDDIILLLKLGADSNYVNPILDLSLPTYLVLTSNLRQFKAASQYFTDEIINRVDRSYYTPFMYAIRNGKIRIARHLYYERNTHISEAQVIMLESENASYTEDTLELLHEIRVNLDNHNSN